MSFDPNKVSRPAVTKQEVLKIIDEVGANFDKRLIPIMKGLVEQESLFSNVQGRINPKDHGVFQINEATLKGYPGVNPYDPVQAARVAFKELDQNVKMAGDIYDGITAYNFGIGNLKRWRDGKKTMTDITKQYAPKVMARANQYGASFALEDIEEANKRYGNNGRTDFIALAGGKQNIGKRAEMLARKSTPPLASPAPLIPQLGELNIAQAPRLRPDPMAPEAPAQESIQDMAASLRPPMPALGADQEIKIAKAFGYDVPDENSMLPEGLMQDIREAIEAA